jgi:FkbM family methyltransferase
MRGKDLYSRPEIRCAKRWFGSDFGGWVVATDPIHRDSIVYSVGIEFDTSFGEEVIRHFGSTVHAFDPTPRCIEWIQRREFPKQFVFHGYGLYDRDATIVFNPPQKADWVSRSILLDGSEVESADALKLPVKRLKTIMEELGHAKIDVLKMDIEGAEYAVIADIQASGIRPTQILVEFHHLHGIKGIGLDQTKEALKKLGEMGYKIFSVSATGLEYSFILP